jgi:uncharacterized protein (TIGR02300 family)
MTAKRASERGTKRACQACAARFYDLNRDPITCPMCQAVFQAGVQGTRPDASIAAAAAAAEKAARKPVKKPPTPVEAELVEGADLPEAVVADEIPLEAAEAIAAEEETFLEQEEEDTDVSGFIDGGLEEGGEEET